MAIAIARIIWYVKDIPRVASFCERHFGMKALPSEEKGWLALESAPGGCRIALQQAAKSHESGAAVKIVFAVEDVRGVVRAREEDGLKFGPVHEPGDFESANAKDRAGNSISVSSRGLVRVRTGKP